MESRSDGERKSFGRRPQSRLPPGFVASAVVIMIQATIAFVSAQPVPAQQKQAEQKINEAPADRRTPTGDPSKKEVEKADPIDGLAKEIEDALKLLKEAEMAKPNARPKDDARKPIKKNVNLPLRPMRSAVAPFVANDTIKIDGDLADWKDIRPITLEPIVRGRGPKMPVVQPVQQQAWLAYCPRGLIVAVDVVDTSGELENGVTAAGNFWLNDCVEIYLDTLNTKSPTRGEPHVHQFFAFPFGSRNDLTSGGHEAYMVVENGRLQTKRVSFPIEKMPRAAKKTETGWTMEILIPKSALRKSDIRPGQVVGFNLQIDTGTNLFYFWNGAEQVQTSMRPNTWGEVQLLGSNAKVELLPGAEPADVANAEPLKSLALGQVVKIRVTDPDMNLDDTKRDTLNVTVRAARGDAKTVILEETGNGTGVFEGSIPTRLSNGVPLAGVLDTLEGDRITVEYIDQVRAAGEGNVPVRVVVPVVGPTSAK